MLALRVAAWSELLCRRSSGSFGGGRRSAGRRRKSKRKTPSGIRRCSLAAAHKVHNAPPRLMQFIYRTVAARTLALLLLCCGFEALQLAISSHFYAALKCRLRWLWLNRVCVQLHCVALCSDLETDWRFYFARRTPILTDCGAEWVNVCG